jgi:hypothetical protein
MVKLSSMWSGRPAWYDRNPLTKFLQFSAQGQAPLTVTDEWTYTVPAGRKAFIEYAFIRIMRRTAATSGTEYGAYISYLPSGGSVKNLLWIYIENNTIESKETALLGQGAILYAGDKIDGYVYDGSTGGTVDYQVVCKLTEFDT